jgi:hypothetical protein
MKVRSIALGFSIVLLSSCGGGFGPPASPSAFVSAAITRQKVQQKVYWTLFAGAAYPQVQIATVPLRAKSKVVSIDNTSQNDLLYSSGMAADSAARLWILSFGQGSGDPTSALVFNLPINAKSAPRYTFVLSGTSGADALAFDPSGNIWVTSPGTHEVFEYKGPFTKSATLTPAVTLNGGSDNPFGIAVDHSAKVYISINNSSGTNSIAVATPPYKHKPYFLNGLTAPGGLAFDKSGNLYASSNGATPAVVRYDSSDLKSGDTPSVVDATGLPANSYEAAFALTAKGDLYAANCGNSGTAGIDVWPLSSKKFGSKLAPSVEYTNGKLQLVGCAWGLAIK